MNRKPYTAICVMSVLILALVWPAGVQARPKQLVNGCSVEQIQSNFGSSCVDQMMQDVKNNKPYTHALLCNGGEMLCCTYDNTTNQIQTCRKPAGSRLMPGLSDIPKSSTGIAGVQRRGVGEADGGDEVPAPSWMTEERMKQLQKDSKGE